MSQPETGTTCDICNQWYPEGYEWYPYLQKEPVMEDDSVCMNCGVQSVKEYIEKNPSRDKAFDRDVDEDELITKYINNKKGGNNDERNIV